ncbi:MAG: hypothetical protein AAFO07_21645, partial [Bacteroidota bacterium]
ILFGLFLLYLTFKKDILKVLSGKSSVSYEVIKESGKKEKPAGIFTSSKVDSFLEKQDAINKGNKSNFSTSSSSNSIKSISQELKKDRSKNSEAKKSDHSRFMPNSNKEED